MAFEIDMLACADHEDELQQYADMLAAEEARIARETIELAKSGKYDRLFNAMDYYDNDDVVMRALVLCANKGNIEAIDAMKTLAATYAEFHAEVAE